MPKSKESTLQLRLDSELKKQAEQLFEDMGLDMSSAIKLFLKQSVLKDGLPFKIKRYPKYTEDDFSDNDFILDNKNDSEDEEPAIINDLY